MAPGWHFSSTQPMLLGEHAPSDATLTPLQLARQLLLYVLLSAPQTGLNILEQLQPGGGGALQLPEWATVVPAQAAKHTFL